MSVPSDDPSRPGSPRVLDLRLHLLDRQIIDADGRLLGKVDDLELSQKPDGALVVTALLCGPVALAPRLGGRLGRWVEAVSRRLSLDGDPAPRRIDLVHVTHIGSAVTVDVAAPDVVTPPLEQWLGAHLIRRIPGSGHESQ
jgi:sporulation protein YlmC with PRC-barrel domain